MYDTLNKPILINDVELVGFVTVFSSTPDPKGKVRDGGEVRPVEAVYLRGGFHHSYFFRTVVDMGYIYHLLGSYIFHR